jgi:hypothetical protein
MNGAYNVSTPDKLGASGGSTIAMNYTGSGSGGAAIQYASGNTRIVNLGFPFEAITSSANRNAVMAAVLNYFSAATFTGSISGRIFKDVNGDGVYTAGTDIPLQNWTAFLETVTVNGIPDAGEPTATTDASGDFSFTGLADGTYPLRQVMQTGYKNLAPVGSSYSVVVSGGNSNTGKDFANFPTNFVGTSGADSYTVRLDPLDNTRLQIIEQLGASSPTTYSIQKSNLASFSIDTQGDQDTITVDYTYGNPLPTLSITLVGSSQNAGQTDQLIINGLPAASDPITITASTISDGGTINYSGFERITFNTSGGNDTLTINGSTTPLVFNGGSGNDVLNVTNGSYTFDADAIAGSDNLAVNVSNSSTVTFNASQHLANLVIGPNAVATMPPNGNRYLQTAGLTVNGTLDLNDNDLVVTYSGSSSFSTIYGYMVSGLNGPTGITSGVRDNSGAPTLLGLLDNATLGLTEWPIGSGNTVAPNAVLGKYTYFGDVNFDGQVTDADYAVLDGNYGQTYDLSISLLMGDANLSGTIDDSDYAVLDGNYGDGVGNPL